MDVFDRGTPTNASNSGGESETKPVMPVDSSESDTTDANTNQEGHNGEDESSPEAEKGDSPGGDTSNSDGDERNAIENGANPESEPDAQSNDYDATTTTPDKSADGPDNGTNTDDSSYLVSFTNRGNNNDSGPKPVVGVGQEKNANNTGDGTTDTTDNKNTEQNCPQTLTELQAAADLTEAEREAVGKEIKRLVGDPRFPLRNTDEAEWLQLLRRTEYTPDDVPCPTSERYYE